MRVAHVLIAGILVAGPALAQPPGNSSTQEPGKAAQERSDARLDMQRAQKDTEAAKRAAAHNKPLKAHQFQSDARIEAQDAKQHQQEAAKAERSGHH